MSIRENIQRTQASLQEISEHKDEIAEAITAKGVDTPQGASFATLLENIAAIETGEGLKAVFETDVIANNITSAIGAQTLLLETVLDIPITTNPIFVVNSRIITPPLPTYQELGTVQNIAITGYSASENFMNRSYTKTGAYRVDFNKWGLKTHIFRSGDIYKIWIEGQAHDTGFKLDGTYHLTVYQID